MRGVKVRERLIHSRIAHVFHASLLRMNFPPLIRLTQQNTLLRVIHYKDVQGLSVCLSVWQISVAEVILLTSYDCRPWRYIT